MAQGPVKRPAGSGPSPLTQTSINSQQHVLQREISSDTKEDSEGENGKTWKTARQASVDVTTRALWSPWPIPAEIRSYGMLPACKAFISQQIVNSSSALPDQLHSQDILISPKQCCWPTLSTKLLRLPSFPPLKSLNLPHQVSLCLTTTPTPTMLTG